MAPRQRWLKSDFWLLSEQGARTLPSKPVSAKRIASASRGTADFYEAVRIVDGRSCGDKAQIDLRPAGGNALMDKAGDL